MSFTINFFCTKLNSPRNVNSDESLFVMCLKPCLLVLNMIQLMKNHMKRTAESLSFLPHPRRLVRSGQRITAKAVKEPNKAWLE